MLFSLSVSSFETMQKKIFLYVKILKESFMVPDCVIQVSPLLPSFFPPLFLQKRKEMIIKLEKL